MQTDELDLQIARIVRASPLLGPLVLERKQFLDRALDEEIITEEEYTSRVLRVINEASYFVSLTKEQGLRFIVGPPN